MGFHRRSSLGIRLQERDNRHHHQANDEENIPDIPILNVDELSDDEEEVLLLTALLLPTEFCVLASSWGEDEDSLMDRVIVAPLRW